MNINYFFCTGKDKVSEFDNSQLEKDLLELVRSYPAELVLTLPRAVKKGVRTARLFTILGIGGFYIDVAPSRTITIAFEGTELEKDGGFKVDGLVTLLGFDPFSDIYKKIDSELKVLEGVYHKDRVKE